MLILNFLRLMNSAWREARALEREMARKYPHLFGTLS